MGCVECASALGGNHRKQVAKAICSIKLQTLIGAGFTKNYFESFWNKSLTSTRESVECASRFWGSTLKIQHCSLTISNKTICVGTRYECQQRQFKISIYLIEEFDHGSDWTLAAGLTHASRTVTGCACTSLTSGGRVSNAWELAFRRGITVGNDC